MLIPGVGVESADQIFHRNNFSIRASVIAILAAAAGCGRLRYPLKNIDSKYSHEKHRS